MSRVKLPSEYSRPSVSGPNPLSPSRSRKAEKAPKEVKKTHSRSGTRTFEAHSWQQPELRCRKLSERQTTLPESKHAIAHCRKTTVSRPSLKGGAGDPIKFSRLSVLPPHVSCEGGGRTEFLFSNEHLPSKPILFADQPTPIGFRGVDA